MNKKDFIRHVRDLLRENNIRKSTRAHKQVFHISDGNGNAEDFTVRKAGKNVIYTISDVEAIIDASIFVIQEALKRGEPVSFYGFGTLGLHYRKPRMTKRVGTNDDVIVSGRYVPKFSFGNTLRMCAKVYELSLDDRMPEPTPRYDDFDENGGDDIGD